MKRLLILPTQKQKSSIGVGAVSLIVMFSALILTLLALSSFSSINHTYFLQQRTLQSIQDLSQSEQRINEKLAAIDQKMHELQTVQDNDDEYLGKVYSYLGENECVVDSGKRTASFVIVIDKMREWVVYLQIMPRDADIRFQIVEKELRLTDAWHVEEEASLWSKKYYF